MTKGRRTIQGHVHTEFGGGVATACASQITPAEVA